MQCQQPLFSFILPEVTHRFSHCCGKNIQITSNGCTASRTQNFNHGLVFSSDPLKRDEIFEIKIERLSTQWSGSLRIGLTSMAISDTTPASSVPVSSLDLTSKLTWLVTGSEVKKSGVTIKENYCPSLERLEVKYLTNAVRGKRLLFMYKYWKQRTQGLIFIKFNFDKYLSVYHEVTLIVRIASASPSGCVLIEAIFPFVILRLCKAQQNISL